MWLIVYSNDHAPLTVRPIYSSSKLRTAQMMLFSLVAMIGLEKCCITSACLQWLCHSGERTVARGPLVSLIVLKNFQLRYLIPFPVFQLSVKVPREGMFLQPNPEGIPCHSTPLGENIDICIIHTFQILELMQTWFPGPGCSKHR